MSGKNSYFMCFVQFPAEETSLQPLELKRKKMANQRSLEGTVQYIQVVTVSDHMLRDICELVLKGVVDTMLESRKEREYSKQTDERRKYMKSHLFCETWREDDSTEILRRVVPGTCGV